MPIVLYEINGFEGFGTKILTKPVVLKFKTKLRKPIEDKNIFLKKKKKLNRTFTNINVRSRKVYERPRKFAENLSRTPVAKCHRRSANFRILKFRMARIVDRKFNNEYEYSNKILKK